MGLLKIENLHVNVGKREVLRGIDLEVKKGELLYLIARGLTQDEATSMITQGFLDVEIPSLPEKLIAEIKNLVAMTAERIL